MKYVIIYISLSFLFERYDMIFFVFVIRRNQILDQFVGWLPNRLEKEYTVRSQMCGHLQLLVGCCLLCSSIAILFLLIPFDLIWFVEWMTWMKCDSFFFVNWVWEIVARSEPPAEIDLVDVGVLIRWVCLCIVMLLFDVCFQNTRFCLCVYISFSFCILDLCCECWRDVLNKWLNWIELNWIEYFVCRDRELIPKIPEDCPTLLRDLMQMCWKQKPDERPVHSLSLSLSLSLSHSRIVISHPLSHFLSCMIRYLYFIFSLLFSCSLWLCCVCVLWME
jgi:hypothetical protein